MKSEKTKSNQVPDDIISVEDLDPKNVKVKISTFISEDVLHWLRADADRLGVGYQTLLNNRLRECMDGKVQINAFVETALRDKFLARRVGRALDGLTASVMGKVKKSKRKV